MSADAHDAARRIVDAVFGGSDAAEPAESPPQGRTSAAPEQAAPSRGRPPGPTPTPDAQREASPARLRARELVAEVFDPGEDRGPSSGPHATLPHLGGAAAAARPGPEGTTASEPDVTTAAVSSAAPSAAALAGRRIVAEAEAAQRARAEAQAAERAAAQRAAEEAETAAHRERALRAREEWLARAQGEAAAASTSAPAEQASSELPSEPPRTPGPVSPATSQEVLFVPPDPESPSPDDGDVLFEVPRTDDPGPPPAPTVDDAGPPASPMADEAGPPPAPMEQEAGPPPAPITDEPGPPRLPPQAVALELPEDPPGPQLAARLVSDVLDERGGGTPHSAGGTAEPSASTQDGARALRAGRWVLVTVAAAVVLALLFPLAVRAVLELVSLS